MELKRLCKVVMLPTNKKAELWINKEQNGKLCSFSQPLEHHNSHQLHFISTDVIEEGDWFITIGDLNTDQSFNFSQLNQCVKKESFITPDGKRERLFISDTKHFSGYNPDGDKYFAKVIATTDSKCNLPKPSNSFIQVYIKEYNKGNTINEVLVEYDVLFTQCTMYYTGAGGMVGFDRCDYKNIRLGSITCGDCEEYVEGSGFKNTFVCKKGQKQYVLKVSPKDNTITVRKVKDSLKVLCEKNPDLRQQIIILFGNAQANGILKPLVPAEQYDEWLLQNL